MWAILAEKNEDKVYVNQFLFITNLQILIKYSFLLNFLHESLMNLIIDIWSLFKDFNNALVLLKQL